MNNLESTFLVIVAQITVPLAAALALSFRRNSSASCYPLMGGAAAVLLLTLCAFLPLPKWAELYSNSRISRGEIDNPTSEMESESVVAEPDAERSDGFSGID